MPWMDGEKGGEAVESHDLRDMARHASVIVWLAALRRNRHGEVDVDRQLAMRLTGMRLHMGQ